MKFKLTLSVVCIFFTLFIATVLISSVRSDRLLVLSKINNSIKVGSVSMSKEKSICYSQSQVIIDDLTNQFYEFNIDSFKNVESGSSLNCGWSSRQKRIWPYTVIHRRFLAKGLVIITMEKILTF